MSNFTYAWEVINKFEWRFLPKIFPNNFIHKFAMHDEYNLVKIDNSYYDIQTTKATSLLPDNGVMTRDKNKNDIIKHITESFSDKVEYTINNGIISFKTLGWCFKVKVVKKLASFNPDLITCRMK